MLAETRVLNSPRETNSPRFAQVPGLPEEHGTLGALVEHCGSYRGREGGHTVFEATSWPPTPETPPDLGDEAQADQPGSN